MEKPIPRTLVKDKVSWAESGTAYEIYLSIWLGFRSDQSSDPRYQGENRNQWDVHHKCLGLLGWTCMGNQITKLLTATKWWFTQCLKECFFWSRQGSLGPFGCCTFGCSSATFWRPESKLCCSICMESRPAGWISGPSCVANGSCPHFLSITTWSVLVSELLGGEPDMPRDTNLGYTCHEFFTGLMVTDHTLLRAGIWLICSLGFHKLP